MEIASIGLEIKSKGLREGIDRLRDLSRQGDVTERSLGRIEKSSDSAQRGIQGMGAAASRAQTALSALAGIMSVREVIQYADAWRNAENQIRQVTDTTEDLTSVQSRLVDVSKDTRSNFDATANLYARLARSTTELGLSQEDLIALTTTINQSFAVSGATADEAAAAITQLSQGLAAGALRGDEFNSVAEQAPGIMRAIAESLGLGIGELREFAATGGITAEIVVNALQGASDSIANDFGGSVATFGQKAEVARTNLVQWIGTSEDVNSAVDALGNSFIYLSENIDSIVDVAKIAAVLYAGRFVGAMTTAAAGMATATSAATALRAAMSFLGGPIGLLVGAGGLLYTFRDELGLVTEKAGLTEEQVESLRSEMKDMSGDDMSNSLASLDAALEAATLKAAAAREELAKLRSENRGSGALGFGGGEVGKEVRAMQAQGEAEERILEINQRRSIVVEEQRRRSEAANDTMNETVVVADRLTDATKKTTEATRSANQAQREREQALEREAAELQNLMDNLFPLQAQQRKYEEDQRRLNEAFAQGTISADQHTAALQRLNQQKSVLSAGEAYGGGGFGSQIGTGSVGAGLGGGQAQQTDLDRWMQNARANFESFDNLAASTAMTFSQSFGTAFNDILTGQTSINEGFRQMGSTLVQSVISAIGQLIAQWLALQAVQLATGASGTAAAIGQAAVAGPAIAAAYTPAATMVSLATLGANSAPAIAGIAATATAAKGASIIGQAHSGWDELPATGTYNLQKGERVVSARQNADLTSYLSNRGSQQQQSGGGAVNLVVNNIEDKSRAGTQERTQNGDTLTVQNFIADIAGDGKISKSLQGTYSLRRKGK